MRPFCAKCCCEMQCTKSGRVVELLSEGRPYRLWSGDEYGCDGCGARVVAAFAYAPLVEHFDKQRYESVRTEHKKLGNLLVEAR